MNRPRIRSFHVAVVLGVVLLAGACWCLYDAYDARGNRPPWILRVLLPI